METLSLRANGQSLHHDHDGCILSASLGLVQIHHPIIQPTPDPRIRHELLGMCP